MTARTVLRRSDPEPVEWLLGSLMCAYGFWLAMPWAGWSFGSDLIRSVWRDELVQGIAFALIGAGHIMSAFRQLDSRLRLAFAATAAGMWSITWLSFTLWRWQSAAVPVYGVHAMAHVWLVTRHWRQIRRG